MLSEPPEILAPDPASLTQRVDKKPVKEQNPYLPLTFSTKWGGIADPMVATTTMQPGVSPGMGIGAIGSSHLASEPIIVDDTLDTDVTLVNGFIPPISTNAAVVGTTAASFNKTLKAQNLLRNIPSESQLPSLSSPSSTLRPTARPTRPSLPRAGDFRRAGPVTPPLHQLYMASKVSLLSSPSTTSISTPYDSSNMTLSSSADSSPRSSASISPRSSQSLEQLMEDQPALLKLLVSENKVLFEENETFRKEFETVQQQLEVKEQLYCECQNALEASKTQCTHLTEKCTHWEGVARRKTQKYSEKRDKVRQLSAELNQATMFSQMFAKSVRENTSEMIQLRRSTEESSKKAEELSSANEKLKKSHDEALSKQEEVSKANEELLKANKDLTTKNSELETKLVDLESLVTILSQDRELLRASFEVAEAKNASLKDRNSSLALELNDLEVRNDEYVSKIQGFVQRNEQLVETVQLLQERERELEQTIADARVEFEDMENALADLENAYTELRDSGVRYEDERSERASVTSDDMDVAALEEAANAVGNEEYEEDEEYERMRRERTSSRSQMRPPSSISDIDTSDPVFVASQIKQLESLIEEYKIATSEYRAERGKHEQQVAKFKDVEEDLRGRIDSYIEIDDDLRQREANYYANCDRREREFLELSDEYEKWRLDCEVREVDVEEERIEVWKHQREIDRREIRLIHREMNCFKREGEVRWRMMCLNGNFEDKERCWRCAKAPKALFPDPESLFMVFDPRDTSDPPRGRQGKPPKKEDGIERAFLKEDDDRPFEFENLDAAKQYIADQIQWERERRQDLLVDEEAERAAMNEEAAEYDEFVSRRVCELIVKADERRRRQKKEREEAEEGSARIISREEAEMLKRAPAYDEEKAKLNVDGLRGLGLVSNPSHYPDHYEEDGDALERDLERERESALSTIPSGNFTFTLGTSLSRARSSTLQSATNETFTFGAGSTFDSATGTTASVVASSSRGGAALAESESATSMFGSSEPELTSGCPTEDSAQEAASVAEVEVEAVEKHQNEVVQVEEGNQ